MSLLNILLTSKYFEVLFIKYAVRMSIIFILCYTYMFIIFIFPLQRKVAQNNCYMLQQYCRDFAAIYCCKFYAVCMYYGSYICILYLFI